MFHKLSRAFAYMYRPSCFSIWNNAQKWQVCTNLLHCLFTFSTLNWSYTTVRNMIKKIRALNSFCAVERTYGLFSTSFNNFDIFFTDPGNGPVKGWATKTRNGRPVDDSTDWSTNSVHHHNSKFQVQVWVPAKIDLKPDSNWVLPINLSLSISYNPWHIEYILITWKNRLRVIVTYPRPSPPSVGAEAPHAPPSRPKHSSTFPHWPLQLPDALTRRWVKRPGDLNLWPFDPESGVLVTCDVGYTSMPILVFLGLSVLDL